MLCGPSDQPAKPSARIKLAHPARCLPRMTRRIQDVFWAEDYADDYAIKNSEFDHKLGKVGWEKILAKAKLVKKTYLEIGCNIGRNLDQLELFDPELKASAVEINPKALAYVKTRHELQQSYCGPVQDAEFSANSFELVFTSGVLIHVSPDDLVGVMQKMFEWSSRYVVMVEYFNRTPISIEYRGRQNLLFKRDFGGLFMDCFDVNLVDYGFLWGRIFDPAGFDDMTYWLFEKKAF
jgi:pseudaminic acid biosynthesis-associated methylase